MGLCSSIAGAGIGFATYEALTVAYRQRMGYAPTPSERGAIAGAQAHALCLCMQLREVIDAHPWRKLGSGFETVLKEHPVGDCWSLAAARLIPGTGEA